VVNAQNKVELRHITVGYQGSTRVVALSGLREGERVIVGAQNGLTAGQTVETKDVTVLAPVAAPATSPANNSQGAQ